MNTTEKHCVPKFCVNVTCCGFDLSVCYKESNPDQLDAFIDEVQQEGRLTGDTKDLLEKLDEDPKKKEETEVLILSIIISSIKVLTFLVLQQQQTLRRRLVPVKCI